MGMLLRRGYRGEEEVTPETTIGTEQSETSAPSGAPAKNAAHDVWIAYAESLGIDDAVSKTRSELIAATEALETK